MFLKIEQVMKQKPMEFRSSSYIARYSSMVDCMRSIGLQCHLFFAPAMMILTTAISCIVLGTVTGQGFVAHELLAKCIIAFFLTLIPVAVLNRNCAFWNHKISRLFSICEQKKEHTQLSNEEFELCVKEVARFRKYVISHQFRAKIFGFVITFGVLVKLATFGFSLLAVSNYLDGILKPKNVVR